MMGLVLGDKEATLFTGGTGFQFVKRGFRASVHQGQDAPVTFAPALGM